MTINNWSPLKSLLTQKFVRSELRSIGISFKSLPQTGEFKVGGTYFTDDLQDALDTGRAMCNSRATATPNPMKIETLESLARNVVGDGNAPQLFFVSMARIGVVTVSRSFDTAYNHWKHLSITVPTECPTLEDRLIGTIASVEVDEENLNRVHVNDDSRHYLKHHIRPGL